MCEMDVLEREKQDSSNFMQVINVEPEEEGQGATATIEQRHSKPWPLKEGDPSQTDSLSLHTISEDKPLLRAPKYRTQKRKSEINLPFPLFFFI